MMSRQQNPPTVSQSLLQQPMGSESDVKPFSIRQYVLASRHRSIFHNWPFPEKYLHMCLNRGLRDVLPPFGCQTSPPESIKDCSNLLHSQNDSKEVEFCKTEVRTLIDDLQNVKNGCDLLSHREGYKVTNLSGDCPSSHEEGNQPNCNIFDKFSEAVNTATLHVHKSRPSLTSSKAMKDKRKRHKGRSKKRFMVDILAVARHCTSEEINRMNKFYYSGTMIEGCQQMIPSESISESVLEGEDSCRKAGNEDHEVANIGITGKGTLLLMFNLNGYNVNWKTADSVQ